MHVGAVQPGQKVVLIDDLVATGGTLRKSLIVFLIDFSGICTRKGLVILEIGSLHAFFTESN
jgi:adenine/guanine phosphoribosyltransferase-like PRPP-binding protein